MSALSILAEECELLNDSKYRSYITQIEKALKSFDSTSEWADLISALGKLNKVLLAHVKYPVIPKRVTIGKRLAQCLHPALPSGVHKKALETYDIIFKCIGTERLAQDLFIYTAGLFPLLSHAAMNVKPNLLAIYQQHFVTLGRRIKPGLNGLLLGLLPGLEEGSEFYDQTNALLEEFCQSTEPSYFYTCLWECIHSCPSVRLPATTFLMMHFNKKKSMEDQLYMIGLNINLMIESICSTVQDTSVLVQRSMLDFLMVAFPLHNSQLTHSDMAKVVKYAINVLLRRDMSLNRRFYAWLLGTSTNWAPCQGLETKLMGDKFETTENTELSYFERFSQDLLIQALKFKLSERQEDDNAGNSSVRSAVLKPFRILISLLDKPEIGPVILESVLLSIFRCLKREFEYSESKKNSQIGKKGKNGINTYEELLKTANLLFGTFEPYFIWDYAARSFEESCCGKEPKVLKRQQSLSNKSSSTTDGIDNVSVDELCQLIGFLLDIVSLETFSETQTEHLPNLLCSVINSLTLHCDQLTDSDVITSLQLCTKILSKVQPTMTTSSSHDSSCDQSHDLVEMVEQVSVTQEKTLSNDEQVQPLGFDEAVEVNRQLKLIESRLVEENMAVNVTIEGDLSQTGTECPIKVDYSTSASAKNINDTVYNPCTGSCSSTTRTVSRKSSKQHQSTNLMQNCIDCFQIFFHELVIGKYVRDEKIVENCFKSLLNCEIVDRKWTEYDGTCGDCGTNYMKRVTVDSEGNASLTTFSAACQLLAEFASFPMYGVDIHQRSKQHKKDISEVPAWLQDLVTCCCLVDNFYIQTAAVSSMLDLIILNQSVQMDTNQDISDNQSSPEGHRSIRILPTLHWDDLQFLSENTQFFRICAEILWDFLGENSPDYHQTTVKLLHILHQVAPSSWICENVIGEQLVHDDETIQTNAFKKFTVLWHLTRNKKTDVIPGKPLRTFHRSMFVILDSLKEETGPLKVIAMTWLTHVIQQGDINRVMEPLLQMLLHPDTARVSVQHVNIHQPRKVHLSESSEENIEANIYAISSEGGNVIYHVSANKDIPKKQFANELKSYALTILGDTGSGTHTAPLRSRSEQELHFDKVDPSNLSLNVNPFGSENSLDRLVLDPPRVMSDSNVAKAKRLNRETCIKEGISFNDKMSDSHESVDIPDDSNEISSESNSAAEDIAKELVEEVLQNVEKLKGIEKVESPKVTLKQTNSRTIQREDSISSSIAGDDLLNSIQKQRVDSPTPSEKEASMFQDTGEGDTTNIHTLHMHMLLYTQKYDYERTLYALSTLKALLMACPRSMVTSLVTTNISTLRAPQLAKLQLLLARHRKSVFGKNFFGEIPADVMSNYRSSMFIETIISVCLYFIRGYYPNLMMNKLSFDDLLGNKQVHIIATESLTLIMSEVIDIMRDSGKNFVSYISDLLQRCKVQKALLHCILAVIYNGRRKKANEQMKVTDALVAFNEDKLDSSIREAFQIKLLDCLQVMIMLEHHIGKFQTSPDSHPSSEWDRLKVNYQPSLNNAKYNLGHPIVQQGMFVSGVLSALKQTHTTHIHRHWVSLVTSSLPYMGKFLPSIVMKVVAQLCRNIETLAVHYETNGKSSWENVPPDHVLTMLEGVMMLCHYCLLENISPVSIGQQTPSSTGNSMTSSGNSSILSNLFNVFNPVGSSRETSPQREAGNMSPVLDARNYILSVMPRIMACMAALWRALNVVEKQEDLSVLSIGAPKVVRRYILEFISPISLPHGVHLLGAIAVAWNDRRKKTPVKLNKKVVPTPCEDQLLLVDLVSAIKVLPIDTLIQTVKDVLNNPPSSELSRSKKGVPLEVNMLQFFYAYVQRTSANQLNDSWPSLCSLLKDSLQINLVPSGQFLLLLILNEFVQKIPSMVDKKNQKEIQELAQKLLEAVSNVAGSSLEQTTWLRKNYAVKPGPQSDEPEDGNQSYDESVVLEKRVAEFEPSRINSADSKYSVQALCALAEITAPLLDVIYSSEEKDKVPTFLTTLLYNIFPYLKNHSVNNLPSIRAASQFLSSVSSYQYTRKAWRKEALELLLDPSFFQMDLDSITYWITIVDNLMTHDKTTYKDLMARVSMTQTGSLNLFSNKEQEIDQKASMLKRLAFTVFCSESDQYQKSIPEIQEKLAESLRISQAPSVMAQVFTCFRVLMLRVSPQHLTSMWPTIITELIHVFLQIEQELSTETDEFVAQVQRIAALDSSWAHLGNGLNAHNNPSWMQLYLSACKLLDLCLALPADNVPQFQLYRWAFIGGAAAGEGDDDEEIIDDDKKQKKDSRGKQAQFKPHIIRLAKLLNTKMKGDVPMMKIIPGRPLLTFTYLRSLQELQPFFNTLCLANQTDNLLLAARQLGAGQNIRNQSKPMTNGHAAHTSPGHTQMKDNSRGIPKSKSTPSLPASQTTRVETFSQSDTKSNQQYIEEVLMRDFLEPVS
ncbi:Protein dopey-1 [Mactra antiquata]